MTRAVVVLPTTTYRATDFFSAAEALGVELVVASEGAPPLEMGDRYVQIDCADPAAAAEAIVGLGDHIPIDAVVAADDAGVVVAALAGERLGLRGNRPEAAAATRDKAVQRRLLAGAEVPQPAFAVLRPDDDPLQAAGSVGFPLVVKPLDRAAGQGVLRVDHAQDLAPTLRRVRAIVGEGADLLLEEFLPGEEVALEGLLVDGELQVLALLDKPDAVQGPAFPETILVTPSRLPEETQTECARVAGAACAALGLEHGPVHIEMKVDRVRVIEVAGRSIGGLCSRSLNFGLMGTTLETLILRNALGWDKPELRRERDASGVLMIPVPRAGIYRGLEGVTEVLDLPGVTGMELTVHPGALLAPPPEGDRYLGFVFARAPQPEQVTDTLRRALGSIEVVME